MDDDQIDSWRLDWRDAVAKREARNDLLLSLSRRPMAATRSIVWRDAAGDSLTLPEQAIATVAPLPFSRLCRVWVDGVRASADIVLDESFRELTAPERVAWTGEGLDLAAS